MGKGAMRWNGSKDENYEAKLVQDGAFLFVWRAENLKDADG